MKRKRKATTAGLDSSENSKVRTLIYQDLTTRLIDISPDIDIALMKKMINHYIDVYYSEENFNAEILINAFKSIKDTVSPTEDEITQAFVKHATGDHKLPPKNKEEKYNRSVVNLNKISQGTIEEIISKNYQFMDLDELEEYVHFLQNILNSLQEIFGAIPNLSTKHRTENTDEKRVPLHPEQGLLWKAGYLQNQIRKYEHNYLNQPKTREFTIGMDFFNFRSDSENWKTVHERFKLDEKSLCGQFEKITTPQELQSFWKCLSIRIIDSLMTEGFCKVTPKASKFIREYIVKINQDMENLQKNRGGKHPNFFQGSINFKPLGITLLSAFFDLFKSHEKRRMQEISQKYKLKRLNRDKENSA